MIDLQNIRKDFPALEQLARGKRLAYLDGAASNLKPKPVVEALSKHYLMGASNVHRGVHWLSEQATADYEAAREKVRGFVNAASSKEVIFTSGTTSAINLVSNSFGAMNLGPGDEILVTHMEHHSNIVPWQMACERYGCKLKVIPIDDAGEIVWDEFTRLLSERTKLLAVVHVSNSLGTVNPVKEMISAAHKYGAKVLVDGAQAIPHMAVDVRELDCDFYAFSAHKMYGPTGVGVLYGKEALLKEMPPFLGGGDMIRTVSFDRTTYADLPAKFEAGTPHIAGVIGLGAAVDYMMGVGLDKIASVEARLLAYGHEVLSRVEGLRFVGTAREKAGVLAFVLDGVHPHDIGTIVDDEGVAIRTGHHCCQPVMERYGVPATARASLSIYNTEEDLDQLVAALQKVREIFA